MEKLTPAEQLKRLRQTLQAEQARFAAEQARQAEQAARLARQSRLFADAVGKVTALASPTRAPVAPSPPEPIARQRARDEANALKESLSDVFEPHALLDTDDALSFSRPGVGADVMRKLRKGHWQIQAHLDLHGLRQDEAREAVGQFVRDSHKAGLRCVRVVHGKGLGSEGKTPVLKAKVPRWLAQKQEVIAYVQAQPLHGGAGALLVLLNVGRQSA
jgi:DNA-nicking Smr family endonuclease